MYECQAKTNGALLSLPHGGHSKDVFRIKVFKDYIKDNVDSWFRWSKRSGFLVEHMEDLILVTGCTLVSSWAAAAFGRHISDAATISVDAINIDGGGAQFLWRNIRGSVEYHNSCFESFDTVRSPDYAFLGMR